MKNGEIDELRDCQLLKKKYVPCYVPNITYENCILCWICFHCGDYEECGVV